MRKVFLMEVSRAVFLIQESSPSSQSLHEIIASAVVEAKAVLIRADFAIFEGYTPHAPLEEISSASLIICDLSHVRPNLMFELGWAQAFGKPIIVITRSGTSLPFWASHFQTIIYDELDLVLTRDLVKRLTIAITQWLTNPEEASRRNRLSKESKRTVFISYSHTDKKYLHRLLVHLKPLEREELIDLWVDTKLKAGDKWEDQIRAALDQASVVILLISADFLASDFIVNNELPPILKGAEEKGTVILPIILKACRFLRDVNLRRFQAFNSPLEPVIALSEAQQEELYDKVAERVESQLRA